MMKIIFKEAKIDEKIIIEPLFAWNDNSYRCTNIKTVLDAMNKLVDENTTIFSLTAGNYEFQDSPAYYGREGNKDIEILVKIIDGHAKEILKVEKKYSGICDIVEILNKEVKNENIRYEMFRVQGELK